jgi:hypothetical protein
MTTKKTPMANESPAPKTTVPLEIFTLFRNLPLELHRQIWRHAADGIGPRIAELIIKYPTAKPVSYTSFPAVLSASRESREVGLKVFEKMYNEGAFMGAIINWERDTLFFNTTCLVGMVLWRTAEDEDWSEKCRRLALGRVCFYGVAFNGKLNAALFFKKPSKVRELVVVLNTAICACGVVDGHTSELPRRRTSLLFTPSDSGYYDYERWQST